MIIQKYFAPFIPTPDRMRPLGGWAFRFEIPRVARVRTVRERNDTLYLFIEDDEYGNKQKSVTIIAVRDGARFKPDAGNRLRFLDTQDIKGVFYQFYVQEPY